MSKRIHVAVIGHGQVAQLHTEILANDGHHLSWVVGRRPEPTAAFASEYGFERHGTDLRAALEDTVVDAVFVCTPSEQHAEQAALSLEAGKHVLVEIPLAMSYWDGRRLTELAERRGLTLMVGHNHRYHKAVQWVRERVESQALTPQSVLARYFLLRRENIGFSGSIRTWTDNLLWHHAQHSLDIVLFLLGITEPGTVDVAAMLPRPDSATGIPMDLSLVVRTPADQLGTVVGSYNSFVSIYDYVVVAREGTFVIENGVLRDRDGVLVDPSQDGSAPDEARNLQDREFVAAILEGRTPATSAESVLPALDVLQRAQDASGAPPAHGGPDD